MSSDPKILDKEALLKALKALELKEQAPSTPFEVIECADAKIGEKIKSMVMRSASKHVAVKSKGKAGKKKNAIVPGDGKTFNTLSQGLPNMKFKFPDNKPYNFTQQFQSSAFLTGSNVAFVNASFYVALSNVTQVSSFTALFDQYRIPKVEAWLVPRNPTSGTTSATNRGWLYSVIDYDDDTVLTQATDYEQYQNCVSTPATLGHYRTARPHVAAAVYSGAFTSFANETSPWIDLASPSVRHYFLKAGISASDATTDEVVIDLQVRFHLQFRNVR